jgi:hypothetical protein
MMGHSTPTVTANIYSDLYSDELDHVATNLDRLHSFGAIRAAQQWWPGAGSNRRPSAFQAEFWPTTMCFSWSDHTRDRHSDVLDQSVWLVGPILAS